MTGGATPILVLVPTPLELEILDELGGFGGGSRHRVELCGFGVAAAAARCAQLATATSWSHILLVGVAGTFDDRRLPIGSAHRFGSVAIDGIGTGRGAERAGAEDMGFRQWPGSKGVPAIEETISLQGAPADAPKLLTVCAASASRGAARERRDRFDAHAEDMEGYGVALAARLCGTPLSIVRGISNLCGERDPRHWKLREALAAAQRSARDFLASEARAER